MRAACRSGLGLVILRRVDDAEALLAVVMAWGQQRNDVRAVLVVGSQARADTPADQWSDTDLALVVDDPAPYLAGWEWLGAFGRPLLSFVEPTAVGPFAERRVLFESGLEVDFALLPVAAARRMAQDPEARAVLRRGFRILVDKLGLEAPLRAGAASPPTADRPDQPAFAQLTHDFWYHLVWAAKKLRRGELWIATQACNCHLKGLLVTLLAWQAKAADPTVDTWHGGRFLERWADPQALVDLGEAYAGYDAAEVTRALWAVAELFQRLEGDCAQRLGLTLTVPHQQLRHQLGEILGSVR
jgi:aminoglycoside 6-adenylyltransferase